jgi:hypothetical protein
VNKLFRTSVVGALSLTYLGYVFHIFSPDFWRSGIGDWMDPYFINSLLEHWHHSFWHLTDPSSPLMYFPAHHALGYSHGLILYAPFYLAVRPLLNPLIAHNVTLVLVMETGIICLYLLFRKFAKLSTLEAIVLTAFFCTSQNVINGGTAIWSQRASVFLIPPILLLMTSRRLVAAFLSGLLAALLLTQDYPTAVFAVLLLGLTLSVPLFASVWKNADRITRAILIAILLVIAWGFYISISGGVDVRILTLRIRSSEWTRPLLIVIALAAVILVRSVRRVTRWTMAFACGSVIGVIVFLWIYLPAYRERHEFPEAEILNQLSKSLHAHDTMRPFLLLIILILAWLPNFKIDRKVRLASVWFLLVSAIVFLVPLRFGDFSLWRLVFEPLPGFAAVRDPKRIIYLYELMVVLAAAALMMRSPARFRAVVVVIALMLIATHWNRETFRFERPTAIYDAWVAAPIDIDPSCRSFFIKGASSDYMSRSDNMWMLYGNDAMFIAALHSIPTLNGYSAWAPSGWELGNPQEETYPERVEKWIRRNGLTDVCAFDIERRTMRRTVAR